MWGSEPPVRIVPWMRGLLILKRQLFHKSNSLQGQENDVAASEAQGQLHMRGELVTAHLNSNGSQKEAIP